ncbi:hypothetical protein BaRGS_00026783 [Batillaria attramentaria]|uniref:Uncharacterized protein n=1 Tax=Batillaria attramentaria TaxID=370345 RepID=A0ABD0K4Y7_9CAEN
MNSANAPVWYQRLNSVCSRQTPPETYKEFCQEHEGRLKVLYPFLTQEQIKGKLLERWKKIQMLEKPQNVKTIMKKQRSERKYPVAQFIKEPRPKVHSHAEKSQTTTAEILRVSDLDKGTETFEAVNWLTHDDRSRAITSHLTLSQEGKTYRGRSFSLPSKVPEVISQSTPNVEKSILKNGRLPVASDGDTRRPTPRVSFSWTEHHDISPQHPSDDNLEITSSPEQPPADDFPEIIPSEHAPTVKHSAITPPKQVLSDSESLDVSPSITKTRKRMVTRSRKSCMSESPPKRSPKGKGKRKQAAQSTSNSEIDSPKFGSCVSSPFIEPPKFGSTPASPENQEKKFCLFEDDWMPPEIPKRRGRSKKVTHTFSEKASTKGENTKKQPGLCSTDPPRSPVSCRQSARKFKPIPPKENTRAESRHSSRRKSPKDAAERESQDFRNSEKPPEQIPPKETTSQRKSPRHKDADEKKSQHFQNARVLRSARETVNAAEHSPGCSSSEDKSSKGDSDCVSDNDEPQESSATTNILLRILMQLKSTGASQDISKTVSSPTQSRTTEVSEISLNAFSGAAPSPSASDVQMYKSGASIRENILCDLFEDPEPGNFPSSKRKRLVHCTIVSKMQDEVCCFCLACFKIMLVTF